MQAFAQESGDGRALLRIEIKKLIVSRMLIVANSGGGKSHAIRKLAEVTHGYVQQIIIDPEGEFVSLREKFDYVYAAAQGGDALAHPKTAKLLAERLLETGVSAIVDIYELKPHERHAFVRIFLEAMVNAPKSLWHPVLVILDEAHVYAPETDKSEAHGAVADIATRGRKRGFCLVAATQRLAKLSKDVAAELNNKLIGRMSLDVDVKRAADEIGMSKKDAYSYLRAFDPGDFYAWGPAIGMDQRKVHVGEVVSSHQKAGTQKHAVPKPTEAILAVLPKLADLPKEAEEKAKTEADLRRELADVRRENTVLKNMKVKVDTAPSTADLNAEYTRGRNDGFDAGAIAGRKTAHVEIEKYIAKIKGNAIEYAKRWETEVFSGLATLASFSPLPSAPKGIALNSVPHPQRATGPMKKPDVRPSSLERAEIDLPISGPQQRILDALFWLKDKGITAPVKPAVGAVAGASPKSSSFANNLGALRSAGLIEYNGSGGVSLTVTGEAQAQAPTDEREMIECWKSIVTGPQAKILEVLRYNHPGPVSKSELAIHTDASATSSSFANNLGALRTLGAIDYRKPGGEVFLTKHAMPE